MTTRQEIYTTLCRLLQPFNANDVELASETEISADLSIDSVSVMDFVMEVEDHFEIDIPAERPVGDPHHERSRKCGRSAT
jgi:acyl carrier protein